MGHNGQCLCGAVRFTLAGDALTTRICWCKDCQHISGNGVLNSLVKIDDMSISGELAHFDKTADSGNTVTRQFCPKCGTQLFGLSSGRVGMMVVRTGNFDDTSKFKPASNIWTSSAPSWACMDTEIDNVTHAPVVVAPTK